VRIKFVGSVWWTGRLVTLVSGAWRLLFLFHSEIGVARTLSGHFVRMALRLRLENAVDFGGHGELIRGN
jgi:hypothetical protein